MAGYNLFAAKEVPHRASAAVAPCALGSASAPNQEMSRTIFVTAGGMTVICLQIPRGNDGEERITLDAAEPQTGRNRQNHTGVEHQPVAPWRSRLDYV